MNILEILKSITTGDEQSSVVVITREACSEIDTLQRQVEELQQIASAQARYIGAIAKRLDAEQRRAAALTGHARDLLDAVYPTIATGHILPAERKAAARAAIQIEQILAARKRQQ